MMPPLAVADARRIGSVEAVSPDEISVLLDIEAPNGIALNTGAPTLFPRINSYVLIPCSSGFLVAQIEWVRIERSQYPKRKGLQDFGVIDLPFPLRRMSLNPLGILCEEEEVGRALKCDAIHKERERKIKYKFSRGVETFPTVGDPVLLPTQQQLKSIVESGENRRVKIGVSPLAGNAEVSIDPDKLFGRHLAVLGNTGSGKSCSVAGLIHWSLDAAQGATTCPQCGQAKDINARFIILDPNGEYAHAFKDMPNIRIYAAESDDANNIRQLQVPFWLWNSAEWCSFTQASSKVQRPILQRALRDIKRGRQWGEGSSAEKLLNFRRYLSMQFVKVQGDINDNAIKKEATKFGRHFKAVSADLTECVSEFTEYRGAIKSSIDTIDEMLDKRRDDFKSEGKKVVFYHPFETADAEAIVESLNALISQMGGLLDQENDIGEDVPLSFKIDQLADHVQMLGIQENVSQYVDFLVMRIRTLLSDSRMKTITSCNSSLTLEGWLNDYICPSGEGGITVIDLSLVPAEIVHILTSVIARMTLEALQRYRRLNKGEKLPTVLVMEEAHTFIRRYSSDLEETPAHAACTQAFEKIAREGRKYGLGLVLSSQRPSELSQTVLSQCNTFLLHRISNDRDQDLVGRLVPDNLRGLLRELPSLPSQKAILLGWATELPILVHMGHLEEKRRPKSDDPKFWRTWIRESGSTNNADWGLVADNWQWGAGIGKTDVTVEECLGEPEGYEDDDLPF